MAIKWPPLLRPMAQALHYRICRINSLEHWPVAYTAVDSMNMLPTHEDVRACRRGTQQQQRESRLNLCLSLSLDPRRRLFADVLSGRPLNCVAARALALSVEQLLDAPPDAAEAKRRLARMLPLVHPDKVAAIGAGSIAPLDEHVGPGATAFILAMRSVLNDSRCSDAIFAPGRLRYGQWGSHFFACLVGAALRVASWVPHRKKSAVLFPKPGHITAAHPAVVWPLPSLHGRRLP